MTNTDLAATDSARLADSAKGTIASAKPTNRAETFIQKRMKRFEGMSAEETIAYFKSAFVKYMPNAIFLLLPVFALLLYLLYRKTGRFFAEHLIFALHIHAFAFVALIISLFLPGFLDIVAPTWILVYLYIALRVVYGESRGRTAGKFAALVFSYMLIFQITMLSVLLGILAYG